MTIHHDKLAYGKLASNKEDLNEKQIEEMLKELNSAPEEEEEKSSDKPDKK